MNGSAADAQGTAVQSQPGAGLAARLEALDTCVISDAMDSLGLSGVLPGIAPVWPCGRIAGPARTMRLRQLNPGESPPAGAAHLGARAIERSAPGDVIVVAHQGRWDSAGWGGLLSAAASMRGIRGVVVDGACRDVDESEEIGLPLFARSSTPVSARGRTVEVTVDEPVVVLGGIVCPGDLIVADRNGVLLIGRNDAERVTGRAEEFAAREKRMRDDLLAGVPASAVMDRRYEMMTNAQE